MHTASRSYASSHVTYKRIVRFGERPITIPPNSCVAYRSMRRTAAVNALGVVAGRGPIITVILCMLREDKRRDKAIHIREPDFGSLSHEHTTRLCSSVPRLKRGIAHHVIHKMALPLPVNRKHVPPLCSACRLVVVKPEFTLSHKGIGTRFRTPTLMNFLGVTLVNAG